MHICTGVIKIIRFLQISSVLLLAFFVHMEANAQGNSIPRKVLALYKSSEGETEEQNNIYYKAQLPLNNLGLVVKYADAEKSLPSEEAMRDYRGILTWFREPGMKNAKRYRRWIQQMQKSGKYVVILGNFGAHHELGRPSTEKEDKEVLRFFRSMGLRFSLAGWEITNPQTILKNKDFYDYEMVFKGTDSEYIGRIQSVSDQNNVLLSLQDKDNKSDFAVLVPQGGYIQIQAIDGQIQGSPNTKWYINPTKFFDQAFRCADLPVADINTIGGFRTAFIHIDGDGFSTISKINRWHICADIIKRRVLTKFAHPFSFSVIASEIDPTFIGNKGTVRVAKEIFQLPNVEAASHGFAHPHNWKTGKISLRLGFYVFDPLLETVGSIKYIKENLVPPDKAVNLFFWTGMCNPNQEEIERLENQGVLQINGGAGKLDKNGSSISTFYPPYGQVGNKIRVNSRICNEYEFTNGWLGPHDGYKEVIKSFEFTDGHRPSTPANIYFHPYIAEFEDGWRSLRQVFKFAEQQDWTFVYTSDYIKSVKDFVNTKISKVSNNEYLIQNDGSLRTIRFRDEKRSIDTYLSENIVGFTKIKGDLLVHLNSKNEHKIVLGEPSKWTPYISYSNQIADSLTVQKDRISLSVHGYGDFSATINNLRPNTYYAIEKLAPTSNSIDNNHKQASVFSQQEALSSTIQYKKSDENGAITFESFVTNSNQFVLQPSSSINYNFAQMKYMILLAAILGFILLQTNRAKTVKTTLLKKILSKKK